MPAPSTPAAESPPARPAEDRGDAFGERFSRAFGLLWCLVLSAGRDETGGCVTGFFGGSVLLLLVTVSRRGDDPQALPMAELIVQPPAAREERGFLAGD